MTRTLVVAGNWKMNTTLEEGLALVDAMLPGLQELAGVERIVCPPFVSLAAIADRLRGTDVRVGAQNVYPELKGAYTGEISPPMLEGLATYVIVGHSERRQYFGEDDDLVNRKVLAAQAAGLTPIVCVGETFQENEAGQTEAVVRRQTRVALMGPVDAANLVLAYEPIWAIGTGRAATPEGANQTVGLVREAAADALGELPAEAVSILYGGSVTADNFAAFIEQSQIDGGLVGGASLKADQFLEIVRQAQAVL